MHAKRIEGGYLVTDAMHDRYVVRPVGQSYRITQRANPNPINPEGPLAARIFGAIVLAELTTNPEPADIPW